jgi:hypothetical protein
MPLTIKKKGVEQKQEQKQKQKQKQKQSGPFFFLWLRCVFGVAVSFYLS